MAPVSKKKKRSSIPDPRQSKREYAVRYYAERDYRSPDAAGGVEPGELKKNWKHVVQYTLSEGDLAQKLATSVTYVRYLRRKVAICQKHGISDPAEIYKLSAGVGEKSLKGFFESKGKPARRNGKVPGGKASKKKAAKKSSAPAGKKSSKKASKKSAKKSSKKAAKKKAARK
ncbi:MAG: hypothetical protein KDK23_10435 [Leptospiraceae bacterium]|nr:hypothetical protein [Leptospiraceae bacterium]